MKCNITKLLNSMLQKIIIRRHYTNVETLIDSFNHIKMDIWHQLNIITSNIFMFYVITFFYLDTIFLNVFEFLRYTD